MRLPCKAATMPQPANCQMLRSRRQHHRPSLEALDVRGLKPGLKPAGISVAGVVVDQALQAIRVQDADVALFHFDKAIFHKL